METILPLPWDLQVSRRAELSALVPLFNAVENLVDLYNRQVKNP
jgi:hypothetical protein